MSCEQFLDEGSSVKVYIPLEGVKEATKDDSVQCSFGSKCMEVIIRDFKPNKVLRLAVKELSGEFEKHLVQGGMYSRSEGHHS